MWRFFHREIQQRRQYLVVILLGSLLTVAGVIMALASLRASSSYNRFVGPIFVFAGFSAVLFGVRWRRAILAAEQAQQIVLHVGRPRQLPQAQQRTFPPGSHSSGQEAEGYLDSSGNSFLHRNGVGVDKFVVAPPYSEVNYPSEPPPPYAPPAYDNTATTDTPLANTPHRPMGMPVPALPYETYITPVTSASSTTHTLTYVQPLTDISQPPQYQRDVIPTVAH